MVSTFAWSILLSILPQASPSPEPGLVGHWRGDDGADPTVATDSSGQNHHGTYSNGATTSTNVPTLAFANPSSMWFNGDVARGGDDLVDIPGFTWSGGGAITVSFWNYISATDVEASTEEERSAFTIGNRKDVNQGNLVQAHAPWTNKRIYWDYGSNVASSGRVDADYAPFLDKWTHVALVSEGNGGAFQAIYLDGVLAASIAASNGPDVDLAGIKIGRYEGPSTSNPYEHRGGIDDFRVYNRVLTALEIQRLAQGFSSTNPKPDAPSALTQKDPLSSVTIDIGGSAPNLEIMAGAVVTDPLNRTIALEVEIQKIGDAYTGTGVTGTPVASGQAAQVRLTDLDPDSEYRWRARAVADGQVSGWVGFGTSADDPEVDVMTEPNIPPQAPVAAQYLRGGILAIGTRVFSNDIVIFEGEVRDQNGGSLRLEVEARLSGASFSGTATATSAPTPSGEVASILVSLDPGSYSWKYRAVDPAGEGTTWQDYGNNGTSPDFHVLPAGSLGNKACGQSAAASVSTLALFMTAFIVLAARR